MDPVFVVSNHGEAGHGPGFRGFKPRRRRSWTRFSWFQTTVRPVVTGVFRGLVGGEDD
jgi:hypothetical protein